MIQVYRMGKVQRRPGDLFHLWKIIPFFIEIHIGADLPAAPINRAAFNFILIMHDLFRWRVCF